MNQPSFKVAGTIAGVKTSKASFSGPANGVTIGVVGAIEKGSTYDLFRHRCNILPPSSATHTCLRSTEHGNCTWYTVLHSEYFHIFTLCAHCTHRRDMKRAWFGMNDNHKVFEKKIYSDGFLKPKFVSYVEAMKPNVQDKFKATYPGGEKDIMLTCGDTELTDAQCVDMFHGQKIPRAMEDGTILDGCCHLEEPYATASDTARCMWSKEDSRGCKASVLGMRLVQYKKARTDWCKSKTSERDNESGCGEQFKDHCGTNCVK